MMTKIFYCPVNGWDCPYFKEDNTCALVDEGDDPVIECDDAASIYDEEDDYFMYRDDNGKEYDTQTLLEMGYHFLKWNLSSMNREAYKFLTEEDIKGHL